MKKSNYKAYTEIPDWFYTDPWIHSEEGDVDLHIVRIYRERKAVILWSENFKRTVTLEDLFENYTRRNGDIIGVEEGDEEKEFVSTIDFNMPPCEDHEYLKFSGKEERNHKKYNKLLKRIAEAEEELRYLEDKHLAEKMPLEEYYIKWHAVEVEISRLKSKLARI